MKHDEDTLSSLVSDIQLDLRFCVKIQVYAPH